MRCVGEESTLKRTQTCIFQIKYIFMTSVRVFFEQTSYSSQIANDQNENPSLLVITEITHKNRLRTHFHNATEFHVHNVCNIFSILQRVFMTVLILAIYSKLYHVATWPVRSFEDSNFEIYAQNKSAASNFTNGINFLGRIFTCVVTTVVNNSSSEA